jgi:hypothetical protein
MLVSRRVPQRVRQQRLNCDITGTCNESSRVFVKLPTERSLAAGSKVMSNKRADPGTRAGPFRDAHEAD